MSMYTYDETQKNELLRIIDLVSEGCRPIVKINDEIFEDCYLENNMYAKIISITLDEKAIVNGVEDLCYSFKLDFSLFEEENKKKESSNYFNSSNSMYDLTATEAGFKPKNCIEEVYHSITHGKIFFSIVKDNVLLEEYLSKKIECSYVDWLEKRILELMDNKK